MSGDTTGLLLICALGLLVGLIDMVSWAVDDVGEGWRSSEVWAGPGTLLALVSLVVIVMILVNA